MEKTANSPHGPNWCGVIIIALICMIAVITCNSCSVSKKQVHSTTIKVHDTTQIAVHDTLIQRHSDSITRYVHDTTILLPGDLIADTFNENEITAPTYHNGRKVPQTYTSSKGSLHSTLTIDTSGHIVITCQADSLKLVVANLVTQTNILRDSLSRSQRSATATISDTSVGVKDVWRKTKTFFSSWWWLIVAGVVVFVIIELLNQAKREKPNL